MENFTHEDKQSSGIKLIEIKNLLEKKFKKNKNVEKYSDVLMKISGIMTEGKTACRYFFS